MAPLIFLPILIYVALVVTILYFIFKWVNTFIQLKQEHNELLKEIIKRMDSK
ncbi:hypothetical protein [uncultured Draconibacterium sp.]|uniref:hypothetical protein n=1 Tax=uncultured Draconibacterium sp. TaxID=1573823 RepID=UPI0025FC9F03|nr:hypothetical protein [uncultured Draconibacterium sp.]